MSTEPYINKHNWGPWRIPARKQMYDEKCEELAKYFLVGEEGLQGPEPLAELAQAIQDCVEDWLAGAAR